MPCATSVQCPNAFCVCVSQMRVRKAVRERERERERERMREIMKKMPDVMWCDVSDGDCHQSQCGCVFNHSPCLGVFWSWLKEVFKRGLEYGLTQMYFGNLSGYDLSRGFLEKWLGCVALKPLNGIPELPTFRCVELEPDRKRAPHDAGNHFAVSEKVRVIFHERRFLAPHLCLERLGL